MTKYKNEDQRDTHVRKMRASKRDTTHKGAELERESVRLSMCVAQPDDPARVRFPASPDAPVRDQLRAADYGLKCALAHGGATLAPPRPVDQEDAPGPAPAPTAEVHTYRHEPPPGRARWFKCDRKRSAINPWTWEPRELRMLRTRGWADKQGAKMKMSDKMQAYLRDLFVDGMVGRAKWSPFQVSERIRAQDPPMFRYHQLGDGESSCRWLRAQ